MRIRIYVMCLRITVTLTYVTSTLDHVLTTSLPRSKNSRTWRGRGQNETISDFEVPTTSLLRPRHVLITSAPRPYYVLHVSTTSSIRAHQVHPVSTTSLLRPHKGQAVHTTRELRFQHVLTVNTVFVLISAHAPISAHPGRF